MSQLDEDIRAADALGISYGYYIASKYDPYAIKTIAPPQKPKRGHKPHFTDEQAFPLWQSGMNDTAIAKELGVSQQAISNWRYHLELPLLSKNPINPQKYRLAKLPDGTSIIIQNDEI